MRALLPNAESGMSLISALFGIMIISIVAVATMNGMSSYYKGKNKLYSLDSAGEMERLIITEMENSFSQLALGGCQAVPVTAFSTFSKTIGPNTVQGRFGTLRRVRNQNEIVLSTPSGTGSGQRSYDLAVQARGRCPGVLPQANSAAQITSCFQFIPNNDPLAPRLSSHAFLRSSQVFIEVTSQIMDLRNNQLLTCNQVIRQVNPNFRRCSFVSGNVCGATYSESSHLGSGIRHTYRLFWESGAAGNNIYNSKQGTIYAPLTAN